MKMATSSKSKAMVALLVSAILVSAWLISLPVRTSPHRQEAPQPSRPAIGEADRNSSLQQSAGLAGGISEPLPVLMGSSTAARARHSLPYLGESELSDGRSFISFDLATAGRLKAGDAFQVDIPGAGTPAIAIVAGIDEFQGIHRLSGPVTEAASSESRFSLTLSDDGNYVTGHFVVNGQEYMLEAKDGAGWVMDARLATKRLIQAEAGER